MSANAFPTARRDLGTGAGAFAFERAGCSHGKPARVVFFDESDTSGVPGCQYYGQLPGDLDGSTLPPAGSPNLFAEVDDADRRSRRRDGSDGSRYGSGTSTSTGRTRPTRRSGTTASRATTLPVAAYVRPQCVYGYGDCVPQKGGPQGLDVLGDRLMFRMNYRNFGDLRVACVLNHTVRPTARTGIRWYELRIPQGRRLPRSTSRAPTRRPTA